MTEEDVERLRTLAENSGRIFHCHHMTVAAADFIRAARSAVPDLLDALDQAEAERDEAVQWVRSLSRTAVDPSPLTKSGARAFLARVPVPAEEG